MPESLADLALPPMANKVAKHGVVHHEGESNHQQTDDDDHVRNPPVQRELVKQPEDDGTDEDVLDDEQRHRQHLKTQPRAVRRFWMSITTMISRNTTPTTRASTLPSMKLGSMKPLATLLKLSSISPTGLMLVST